LRLDLAMVDILGARETRESDAANDRPVVMTERELTALQKENMLTALHLADWRVSGPNGAARLVGLKPSTFTDRMRKFRLRRPRAALPRGA
jgi:transcriptional regulator of acetoin/glycerol metabolism